jgi:hypothetical protein
VHVLAATSEGVLIPNGAFAERHRRIIRGHQRKQLATPQRRARKCTPLLSSTA